MMNKERDKFLTEQLGECWHEAGHRRRISNNMVQRDCACGVSSMWEIISVEPAKYRFLRRDFSTWENFGKLWEWSQQQEWWREFSFDVLRAPYIFLELINPDNFANAVCEFLKSKEN